MNGAKWLRPSSHPAGHGRTIGTPRLYDICTRLIFLGGRRRYYRKLLEAAAVKVGDRVLDIGCGPGFFTRMLAEAVGTRGYAVGVDAAPEMIEFARRKARRLSNCRFETGTAESLAFSDGSFDVVVSSFMLHHLPDEIRIPAASEMLRVLRPGGSVLLADLAATEHGGGHIVAILHRRRAKVAPKSPLDALIQEAGFAEANSGDAAPWLHYVTARKPETRLP